jgi:hypothetical protein
MAGGRRREKNERGLPSEEKREGPIKKSVPLSRRPCSPFSQTRGQVTLMKRRRLCMHNRCMG